jgi:hypothetical protein
MYRRKRQPTSGRYYKQESKEGERGGRRKHERYLAKLYQKNKKIKKSFIFQNRTKKPNNTQTGKEKKEEKKK